MIVTGGTGLIGRELSASLSGKGHEVIILSRHPERYRSLLNAVSVEHWDALNVNGWTSLLDGADAVINLTGENIAAGRWTAERKLLIRESRLNAGRAIVRAIGMVTHKPKVVVQASGIGYYGHRGDAELGEDEPPGNDFLACLAKDWEDSTAPVRKMGVRQVIIRTGIVLSTKGGGLPRMILLTHLFAGRLGHGHQWFPWIHVKDEVDDILFLIENEQADGAFNLTAPNPVTEADFSQYLGKRLGRPILLPVPAVILRVLLGEMATALLCSQKALPRKLLRSDFSFQFPQLTVALGDLLS